jgi:hypothetical protein
MTGGRCFYSEDGVRGPSFSGEFWLPMMKLSIFGNI